MLQRGVLQQSTFAEVGIIMSPGSILYDFGRRLGPVRMWILAFLVPQLVIWHDWWLHFGVLGTLWRSWDIGEHKKGQFEIQAYIFRDPILKVPWTNKCVFVVFVSRLLFLMVFGFESGCPRLEI